MLRRTFYLAVIVLAWGAAPAQDLLPRDHGLRYAGKEGSRPVQVEITLREQPDGSIEYVEWVMPQGWARWLTRTKVRRATLAWENERLLPLGLDPGDGVREPPAGLPADALDELSVRLRARADIARGLGAATYQVWRADGSVEQWELQVEGPDTVDTPDGAYQALRFRLGTAEEWLTGWSAPLLVFHFVRLEHWQDGRKTGELALEEKQL
jgi:hypothetical protein